MQLQLKHPERIPTGDGMLIAHIIYVINDELNQLTNKVEQMSGAVNQLTARLEAISQDLPWFKERLFELERLHRDELGMGPRDNDNKA